MLSEIVHERFRCWGHGMRAYLKKYLHNSLKCELKLNSPRAESSLARRTFTQCILVDILRYLSQSGVRKEAMM
jgi:hypothetical protein